MAYNKEDCTGIYLLFFKSTQNSIKNKTDFIDILRESGRHVDKVVLNSFWKPETKEILFEEYLKICHDIPIITKTDLVKALKKMDEKNEGFLDKADFIRAMSENGMKLSRREITDIVNKVDVNGSGKIHCEELATLLLSNLEKFKSLGKQKLMESEDKITRKSISGESSSNPRPSIRPNGGDKEKSPKKNTDDNDDDDDIVVSGRPTDTKDSANLLLIEKKMTPRYDYREPKTLKTRDVFGHGSQTWKKETLRGCIFLGDVTSAIVVQNPNIECHTYKFTLNSNANVIITMSQLTILQNIDLKKIPDLGFIIVNKRREIVALSLPVDASGSVYYQGSMVAGSYSVIPFTTGAKLVARSANASDNFKNVVAVKKGHKGEYTFTNEMKYILEDIFKICDIDGNGYLNKEEYRLFFEKTNEDDWEDDLWNDIKGLIQLHNDEIPFSEFAQLIMKEIKEDGGDTSSLLLALDIFGYSDKCLLEEAFPFSLTFQVENSEFLAKCLGISNEYALIESALCDFVINDGEKLDPKSNWRDCSFYTWFKGGRFLIAMENVNSITKQTPLRINVNLSKSINVTVYKEKLERDISIVSGTKMLTVHGVPIEPKLPISINCSIRRL